MVTTTRRSPVYWRQTRASELDRNAVKSSSTSSGTGVPTSSRSVVRGRAARHRCRASRGGSPRWAPTGLRAPTCRAATTRSNRCSRRLAPDTSSPRGGRSGSASRARTQRLTPWNRPDGRTRRSRMSPAPCRFPGRAKPAAPFGISLLARTTGSPARGAVALGRPQPPTYPLRAEHRDIVSARQPIPPPTPVPRPRTPRSCHRSALSLPAPFEARQPAETVVAALPQRTGPP